MSETPQWKSAPETTCPKCKEKRVKVRKVDDDEGHEDYNFRCMICKHDWWIDGIDS